MSLSSHICSSNPPVIVDPIVLEEHQLTSDEVKLQLRPDLHQRSIVVWMLTPVGHLLSVGSSHAVEVETAQPAESGVDPVIRAESGHLVCLLRHFLPHVLNRRLAQREGE